MFKKFRSPHGAITISNTSGHSALIDKDFVSVHESLWKLAYMEGAVTEDMIGLNQTYIQEKKAEQVVLDDVERLEVKEKMKVILDNPTLYLNSKNGLMYHKIISLLKKSYKLEYLTSIWEEILAESK